ncbi:unnamed protein product [Prunus armeniaca]|uniref:Uncharacterized protein n=1 Tax=Prunus armeniaca TaxID=36596 RepID=A0A6J5XAA6_PRUAR|nr:unnamed protein product [Prunus armeniaca]
MLGFVEGVLEGCTVDAMSESEKHFVSHVLSFFAASDGIVLETYFKDSREKHRLFNEIESEGRLSGLWIGYTVLIHMQRDLLLLHVLKESSSSKASAPYSGLKEGANAREFVAGILDLVLLVPAELGNSRNLIE